MSDPDRSLPIRALAGAADVALLDRQRLQPQRVHGQLRRARPAEDLRPGLEALGHFARVSVKNRHHAAHNPGAQYRQPLTRRRSAREPDDRRAADAPDVLPDRRRRRRAGRCTGSQDGQREAIHVRASALSATGGPAPGSVAERAAAKAREQAGFARERRRRDRDPRRDRLSRARGLRAPRARTEGRGNRLIVEGKTRARRRVAGQHRRRAAARGHPVGATGVLQIAELVDQLRGRANGRQVDPVPRLALGAQRRRLRRGRQRRRGRHDPGAILVAVGRGPEPEMPAAADTRSSTRGWSIAAWAAAIRAIGTR